MRLLADGRSWLSLWSAARQPPTTVARPGAGVGNDAGIGVVSSAGAGGGRDAGGGGGFQRWPATSSSAAASTASSAAIAVSAMADDTVAGACAAARGGDSEATPETRAAAPFSSPALPPRQIACVVSKEVAVEAMDVGAPDRLPSPRPLPLLPKPAGSVANGTGRGGGDFASVPPVAAAAVIRELLPLLPPSLEYLRLPDCLTCQARGVPPSPWGGSDIGSPRRRAAKLPATVSGRAWREEPREPREIAAFGVVPSEPAPAPARADAGAVGGGVPILRPPGGGGMLRGNGDAA